VAAHCAGVVMIIGLRVRLDRGVDHELGCHDNIALIHPGRDPYGAQLRCIQCQRHRGWLAQTTTDFLSKTVSAFGVPPEPFRITDATRQGGAPPMNRAELFPSRFLKHADLKGRACIVVIDAVMLEDIDEEKQKPVLHFKNKQKGLVCNATNYDTIADAYGDETDGWTGQPIELYPTRVPFKGKMTDAVRVRIPPAAAPSKPEPAPLKPKPATPDADLDDEIVF
jgi:hypothetical protein